MSNWAVLVVHGVGDTRPGATVDGLVASLSAVRPGLKPDGQVEVHWLPDRNPAGPPRPDAPPFPLHVRRADVAPGGAGEAGPDRAVFAEVFWGDLSTIREGALYLLLSLMSTIFSLRFVADQAALMPRRPKTPAAERARSRARWLRWLLHVSAVLLCGPVAALTALLACTLGADYLVLRPNAVPVDLGMLGLCGLAGVAGGAAWWWCRWERSGSTWTRFWSSFTVAAVLTAALAAWLLARPADPVWLAVLVRVRSLLGIGALELRGTTGYAATLLMVMQLFFSAIVVLMALALVVWIATLRPSPRDWQAGLAAAYGAGLLQLALWLLVVVPLALAAVRSLLPDEASRQIRELLGNVQWNFVMQLTLSLGLGVVAATVVLMRRLWVRGNPPPYAFPHPGPDIPRLLVHRWIIAGLVGLSLLAMAVSIDRYALRLRPDLPLVGVLSGWIARIMPESLVQGVPYLLVSVALMLSATLSRWLRVSLHIVVDVINHFYRRFDPVAAPWTRLLPNRVQEFEIQQHIEARFRAVQVWLLSDPDVTRLTVVAHSQGTVIAVDVLSLTGLKAPARQQLLERLDRLEEFHLLTMGSPLTHLYQHYFPNRYPSLADPCWYGLKRTLRHWVNLYRVDDFVGTYVEAPVPGWVGRPPHAGVPIPHNVPIEEGGHTRYWGRPEVFELPSVRDTLPG